MKIQNFDTLVFGRHNQMMLKIKAKSFYFGAQAIELSVVVLRIYWIVARLEMVGINNDEGIVTLVINCHTLVLVVEVEVVDRVVEGNLCVISKTDLLLSLKEASLDGDFAAFEVEKYQLITVLHHLEHHFSLVVDQLLLNFKLLSHVPY